MCFCLFKTWHVKALLQIASYYLHFSCVFSLSLSPSLSPCLFVISPIINYASLFHTQIQEIRFRKLHRDCVLQSGEQVCHHHPLQTLTRFFRKIIHRKAFPWHNLKSPVKILSNYHILLHGYDCLLYSWRKNNAACFPPVFSESNFESLEKASKYLHEYKGFYSSIQCKRIVQITTHTHHLVVRNK